MRVSTPGRICLLGEHQDYLGLPVIAAAISLRICLSITRSPDPRAILRMPDIGTTEDIPLTEELTYRQRDYLRAAVNIVRRRGLTFHSGCEGEVRSTIPVNSGTSSSSALVVSWLQTLSLLSERGTPFDPLELAELGFESEVKEFGAPGGMMDHYATAVGGVIYLETGEGRRLERLPHSLGSFVLADSGQPKDTTGVLARVKNGVLGALERLRTRDPDFSLRTVTAAGIHEIGQDLSEDERALLEATVANREITKEARRLFLNEPFDHGRFGTLLNRHQSHLREPLRISTPRIDEMIQAAYDAGALGAKINGSGGGGCMFAYAPEDPETVKKALEPFGRTWIVKVDEGTRVD